MGELLRHSDTAMYQAKDRGRNNFQLFSPGMDRAEGAHRHRVEPAHRARSSSSSTCTTSRSSTSSPTASWRSRRCCAGSIPTHGYVRARALHRRGRGGRPHRADRRVRAASARSRTRRAGGRPAPRLVPVAMNISAVQLQRSNLAGHDRAASPSSTAWSPRMLQIELTESAVFERREARSGEASEDAVAQAARARRAHRHR